MRVFDSKDSKTPFTIGIVASRFNYEITKLLLEGSLSRLKECGFTDTQITVVWVPGAVEIPIAAQRLAQMGVFEAILCLGAVIRGETSHYDYVCQQVSTGCQHVALQNDLPVVFGVLTTENEAQARERAGGKEGNKGRDGVDTAMEMASLLRQIG